MLTDLLTRKNCALLSIWTRPPPLSLPPHTPLLWSRDTFSTAVLYFIAVEEASLVFPADGRLAGWPRGHVARWISADWRLHAQAPRACILLCVPEQSPHLRFSARWAGCDWNECHVCALHVKSALHICSPLIISGVWGWRMTGGTCSLSYIWMFTFFLPVGVNRAYKLLVGFWLKRIEDNAYIFFPSPNFLRDHCSQSICNPDQTLRCRHVQTLFTSPGKKPGVVFLQRGRIVMMNVSVETRFIQCLWPTGINAHLLFPLSNPSLD